MASQSMTTTITEDELDWLIFNWTPGNATFRAWLAGSDYAQGLIALLIKAELKRHEEVPA